jgi:hypothetical protein
MNGLDAIMRASKIATIAHRQMGPAMAVSKMLDSIMPLRNQFGFRDMEHAVLKNLGLQRNVGLHKFVADDFTNSAIVRAVRHSRADFGIPSTVFDTLRTTTLYHNQLFDTLRKVTEISRPFAHFNSMQFAMSGISGKIAAIAAVERQWQWLEDFEQVSEELAEVAEDIAEQASLSEETKLRLQQLREAVIGFYIRNKKYGPYFILFFSVAMYGMGVHQYVDFLRAKPEPATKEDILKIHKTLEALSQEQINERLHLEDFKRELAQAIIDSLKHEGRIRATIRACKVFLKPNTRSSVVITLPAEFEVTSVQQNHKWVYVNFYDPTDDLPQAGWIMKKYLRKEKPGF